MWMISLKGMCSIDMYAIRVYLYLLMIEQHSGQDNEIISALTLAQFRGLDTLHNIMASITAYWRVVFVSFSIRYSCIIRR
jgi:hypothetical protein